MKQLLPTRLLALGVAIGAAALLVPATQAGTSSPSRPRAATGTLVALRTTALGTILVDAHGRTLYLFEQDRNGMSMCKRPAPSTGRRSPAIARPAHVASS
jgi:predicted lipoprotein with Yx(FWY)xxD motif